jgi:hypothetical protein
MAKQVLMTEEEERYFDALHDDRVDNHKTFEKRSMRGAKKAIVDIYSDQAHFIYELLQNADDARATYARFILKDDELIFAHNGKKFFSISDPKTEDEDSDSEPKRLGDINALASIGNSSKGDGTESGNSIGKFGIGFKSVFAYTQSPHIYDRKFSFKIENLFVPVKIDGDHANRKPEETLFVFPFNDKKITVSEAYENIYDKLRKLICPILFLNNLLNVDIVFERSNKSGEYKKTVNERIIFENTDTVAERISLFQNNGEENSETKMWLFTRNTERHKYSVGFLLDDDGNLKCSDTHKTAFCFFPTKQVTGLNFVIHAPFLLNNSRENIKASEQHNKDMIKQLAKLSADSLVYLKEIGAKRGKRLINDDIFEIIPYNENAFNNDKDVISFKSFYSQIKNAFSNEEILPDSDGGYASSQNAYWANYTNIPEVFSSAQLAKLLNEDDAKWVFASSGREETVRQNKEKSKYIGSITKTWYDHEEMINLITADFIENQEIDWLHKFYKYIKQANDRVQIIKTMPVFLDRHRKAARAYDYQGQAVLFLPVEDDDSDDYPTVNAELLKNGDTDELIKKQLGIKPPDFYDEINHKIIPNYKDNNAEPDVRLDFRKFFSLYRESLPPKRNQLIRLIKDIDFILYYTAGAEILCRGKGNMLYIPSVELREYFRSRPDKKFVAYKEYLMLAGEDNKDELDIFLSDLGVKSEPGILWRELDESEGRATGATARSTREEMWTERYIDGCKEVVNNIINSSNHNLSTVLWKQLLAVIRLGGTAWVRGRHDYFFRGSTYEHFISTDVKCLRTKPWLLNKSGELKSAGELTLQDISELYDTTSEEARKLLEILEVKERVEPVETDDKKYDNLSISDELKAKLELADKLQDIQDRYPDIPLDELISVLDKQLAKERGPKLGPVPPTPSEISGVNHGSGLVNGDLPTPGIITEIKMETKEDIEKELEDYMPPARIDVIIDDNEDTSLDDSSGIDSEPQDTNAAYDLPTRRPDSQKQRDSGEEITKEMKRKNKQHMEEMAELNHKQNLSALAAEYGEYSYFWFRTLLEMELIERGEDSGNSWMVSISFSKVERETERFLVLKFPNREIPQFMEDFADIPLELYSNGTLLKKLPIEVMSVHSDVLRVKLKPGADISDDDLKRVTEAQINAKKAVFLMESLRDKFCELKVDKNFDMRKNLCPNIEFVFGPPGTGKTTYLADKIIIPIMRETEDKKILVLTPTNKAADVLVRRVIEIMGEDSGYLDWLVRFANTYDEVIEKSDVLREKTFDIRSLKRSVTVATIDRFPYDYFISDDRRKLFLCEMDWDYIIFDEASMIPLVKIIYPLYAKKPEKFIVAGDPFQIDPIVEVNEWEGRNIYTMTELNSFDSPSTVPHKYQVTLLKTQYRSIPAVGEIFSQFKYGGKLAHHRTDDSRRHLFDGSFDEPLNIIKFPVRQYESVYKAKSLNEGSHYHIYSALFTAEFVKYISGIIEKTRGGELVSIGVIAPYRVQANLVDKLISSAALPKNIKTQAATVHGFQGDECDIIIALFNPPSKPESFKSERMYLNRDNIINVAISRARDYLFVVMPDNDTKNINNLWLIKEIERLCTSQNQCMEWQADEIEEMIFEKRDYIEKSSFSTTHQPVNVYGKPDMRYEVRSGDDAVDVQVHIADDGRG